MNYDVVIVGAGMVGAALAAALGQAGLSIALVERSAPQAPGSEPGLRVSAISPTSQQILTHLGVWQGIAQQRIGPYQRMQVWDALSGGGLSFDAAEIGVPLLGHIVENQLIQHQLWTRLGGMPNVVMYCPDEVRDIHFRSDQVQLSLSQGANLRCSLVVGADGARSRIRQLAEIDSHSRDYQQSAVVCHVSTEVPHANTAWQCFQASGPVAFLPLANGCCSVVWSTDPEQAMALVKMGQAAFERNLAEALEQRLGAVSLVSKRAAFPLAMQWSSSYIGQRVALIGDAAHVIHPLAGLGVNLGFKDAAALSETLLRAQARDQDPGQQHVLRRYERWRKGDNLLTAATMHGIKHLFSNAFPPLAWLRGAGLNVVSGLAPVRHSLARFAVGQTGDLPEMARIRLGLPS